MSPKTSRPDDELIAARRGNASAKELSTIRINAYVYTPLRTFIKNNMFNIALGFMQTKIKNNPQGGYRGSVSGPSPWPLDALVALLRLHGWLDGQLHGPVVRKNWTPYETLYIPHTNLKGPCMRTLYRGGNRLHVATLRRPQTPTPRTLDSLAAKESCAGFGAPLGAAVAHTNNSSTSAATIPQP